MAIPSRVRLNAGRTVLRRSDSSLQFGVDPRHALVLDGLSRTQADVLSRLDGWPSTADLIEHAGGERDATVRLLGELVAAGLIEPADPADECPAVLAPDIATWALRCGRRRGELVTRRATATVEVHGNGRLAIGVATLLAAAGIGAVKVHASGVVTGSDVGTGYLPRDVGRRRQAAATAALHRARTTARAALPPGPPDVVVLADAAAWDPNLALRLVADRIPHLAVHAREASVVIGPLVLPGRTGCLRCADLHRTEADPCWPRIAAQLASRPAAVSLPCAQVAAGMAAEQVLALLTGPGEAPDEPPATGTTIELDPLLGDLVRRSWPAHPRCGCGAAGPREDRADNARWPPDRRQSKP